MDTIITPSSDTKMQLADQEATTHIPSNFSPTKTHLKHVLEQDASNYLQDSNFRPATMDIEAVKTPSVGQKMDHQQVCYL
jgi:hypothetical protein